MIRAANAMSQVFPLATLLVTRVSALPPVFSLATLHVTHVDHITGLAPTDMSFKYPMMSSILVNVNIAMKRDDEYGSF